LGKIYYQVHDCHLNHLLSVYYLSGVFMKSLVRTLVLVIMASASMASDAAIDPNAVFVIAQGGLFDFQGAAKVALADAGLGNMDVYDFLDSAGATSIKRVFPEFQPDDTLFVNSEGDAVHLINLSEYYQIEFADSVDWQNLDSNWAGTDSFQVIGQVTCMAPCLFIPNDTNWNSQWYLQSSDSFSIGADSAWTFTTGNPSVLVGVVDGGLDRNHPDFIGRQISGLNVVEPLKDYSDDQDETWPAPGNHGTPVTGLIAAMGNNITGVAGVNWKCSIYFAKIAANNELPEGAMAKGIAVLGGAADIINCSAGQHPTAWDELTQTFDRNPTAAACYNTWRKGTLIVAGKGNDSSEEFFMPADLPTVLGVSASRSDGRKAEFSNYGSGVDLAAPGVWLYTLARNSGYTFFTGTSAATPLVTGVASLIKSLKPELDADEIEQIMKNTALDRGDPGRDDLFGYGIVRADRALAFTAANRFFRKTNTTLTRTEISGSSPKQFANNGGLATGIYFVKTYRVTAHFDYPEYNFQTPPVILLRDRVSKGWSLANPNNEMPYMQVASGSVTTTSCDINTYAYEVWNGLGQALHWYPCDSPPCQNDPDIRVRITHSRRAHFACRISS
jgi:subtilisin family serine protease